MSEPRAVTRRDGSIMVIRELDGQIEQFEVPKWVAEHMRQRQTRCFCMNPCAGGCKHPTPSVCIFCTNGLHDPNPARDFVEARNDGT